ncbi:MAG: LacI family DNA-binding transcriptional regulator [Phycisphaerales bacterium]
MSSVRKVAAEAGVSPATVSRIFNNDPDVDDRTRARVVAVANRLGYVPKVGRRVTTLLGVALPRDTPEDLGTFYGAVVAGSLRGAQEVGFVPTLLDVSAEQRLGESYTQFFARRGVRGVVLPRLPGLDAIVEDLTREGFPHIIVADRSELPGASWIDTASRAASREAVTHLIELRHTRIAIGSYRAGGTDAQDRLAGYTDALDAHGMPIDPRLVFDCGPELDDGARLVDRALSMASPPTALFITHSMASLGALRRLLDRGVGVPEDVSLIGFDDCRVRDVSHPRMTVVKQDTFAMAQQAALRLARSLEAGVREPIREQFEGEFEVNRTTTVCPGLPTRVLPDGRLVLPDREV